jgi:hypothetical protein
VCFKCKKTGHWARACPGLTVATINAPPNLQHNNTLYPVAVSDSGSSDSE